MSEEEAPNTKNIQNEIDFLRFLSTFLGIKIELKFIPRMMQVAVKSVRTISSSRAIFKSELANNEFVELVDQKFPSVHLLLS